MLDPDRFQQLYHRLGGCGDASSMLSSLMEAYAQPHRAYHTLVHLQDCLQQFDRVRNQTEQPDEVEMALWFHDAVYMPQAGNNEEQSATWATEGLLTSGVDADRVSRMASLILDTRHDRPPATQDCKILLDVDLSILGREPAEFAAYERQIRTEYHWVAEEAYCTKRAAILESFLARPAIYQTEFFRSRLETQARENLTQSIARLRRRQTGVP
ncbi:MAG TPA: hypothetical protein V6C65_24885 [Allocoleopsis sp.]